MKALEETEGTGLRQAELMDVGRGYLEARAALVEGFSNGLTWKAGLEAGMKVGKGQSIYGTVYAEPGDVAAAIGYRFEW